MSPAPVIIAPAIIAAQRNRIIRSFRKAAALSPQTAQTLETLTITRGLIVRRMIKSGVLREEAGGRFWLDSAAEVEAGKRRVKIAIAVVIGALVLVGVIVAVAVLVK